MSKLIEDLYEFGEFRLDAREKTLWRGRELVSLAPKVFDTLFLLVQKQGNLVTKAELMDTIWEDSFVEESNLTQNIYLLRQILGKTENFIETVPRKGYRFAAPVRCLPPVEAQTASGRKEVIVATKTRTRIVEETVIEEESGFREASKRVGAFFGKNLPLLAFTVLLVAALGFFGYRFWPTETESQVPATFDFEFARLTDTGDAFYPTISPDGKFMAYLKDERHLRLKDINSGNDIELKIETDVKPGFLQFSPDGNQIFFRTKGRLAESGEIHRISYFGGPAKPAAGDVWGLFSISPDGRKLAFYRQDIARHKQTVVIRDLQSGEERAVAERIVPKNIFFNVYPAWSPDGRKIAFVPVEEGHKRAGIVFVDLETGREETIETGLANIRQVAWLPGRNELLVLARDKTQQIFRLDYRTGQTKRLTNDLNNYRSLSITADGKRIVTQQRKLTSQIWIVPRTDIGQARSLNQSGAQGLYELVWTPDGKIIFDVKGEKFRWMHLSDPVGGTEQTLIGDEGQVNSHSPVGDGRGNIYFVSNQSGSLNIWRTDGMKRTQITFDKNERNLHPAISPDGRWLYFIKQNREATSLWRKSLTAEDMPDRVFATNDFSMGLFSAFSPDGRYLAFHYLDGKKDQESGDEDDAVRTRIGFLDVIDGREVKVFEINANRALIRWTNGGKTFDCAENTRGGGKIWRQDFANPNAPPELVFQLPDERIINFDWSPDGRDLAIARGDNLSDAVMISISD
ncbi:MAG: winged helix-turn-helix domain-containing protein [Pyrinomonadaceae bacterium]